VKPRRAGVGCEKLWLICPCMCAPRSIHSVN
jgi:hypothetical protein